jgi:phage terminase large subunit
VEEAQSLSDRSMTLLRPTIRADKSEIWLGWNPRRKADPVEQIFREGDPPTNSIVIRANWSDNPWFPAVLEQERLDCLAKTPDQYDHIWEGGYQVVVKGAYYAAALAQARRDGRIGFHGADPLMAYRVSVDIGGVGAKADAFSMWVAQWIGTEIRWLNHYEAQGQEAGEHIAWLERNGYKPNKTTIYLPHDGAAEKGPTRGSWEQTFRDAGYSVIIVSNQGAGAASKRIAAARRLFPRMTFNDKTTENGRELLGAYHERLHEQLGVGLGPEHDYASHSSDAFGLMCAVYREPTTSTLSISPPRF